MVAKILHGLSETEAQSRLNRFGPNVVKEQSSHPLISFLLKFWAPVPWMLEVTLILEILLHKDSAIIVISLLLVFNAVLGFSQEQRAQDALALLRKRLHIRARVFRDNAWKEVPAADLVPGDYIHTRVGDLVPADLELAEGAILVDQSALTGESVPAEREAGALVYSGSIIRRGEASGEVTATGSHSYFGKTAELVRTAKTKGHLEELIFSIVRYLVIMDGLLVVAILIFAVHHNMPLTTVLPFALILLVASVPVALPATFTLATAMASLSLAHKGVLVTRLSAIEDAAAMTDLFSDKTGTLTQNSLTLSATRVLDNSTDADLLAMAAIASDRSTQDPIDLAILEAVKTHGITTRDRTAFIPFDPSTKRSEARFLKNGVPWRAMKGAPPVIAQLAEAREWEQETRTLAADGARVLAIAEGPENGPLELTGLIALSDPPRPDALAVLTSLRNLGIRVRMVTGDTVATARVVASALGMDGAVCGREQIQDLTQDCAVYAGVFPEDKFHLVQKLQKQQRVTAMTGDGVNDAPALKQAEVGIAVASATDVAKAAASLVLTEPGLGAVVSAITAGRRVYQRMLTYILNKIVKTIQVALFLSLGLLLFHQFVVTPLLVLLLLFANDFVTMSIADDNVRYSPKPDRWNVRALMLSALVLAIAWLFYTFLAFAFARYQHLSLPATQTFDFLALVFSGLANVFLVRERGHVWESLPGRFLILASCADILIVSLLASRGILMSAVPWTDIGGLLAATLAYMMLLDQIKVPLLHRMA